MESWKPWQKGDAFLMKWNLVTYVDGYD